MIRRPLRLYELESLMRTDEILSLHWTDIESLVTMLDETIGKLTMVRHNLSIALTLPTTKHKEEL